jgi:hypothetical protein
VHTGPTGPVIPAGPAPARAALGPGPQFSFNNAVDDEPPDDSATDRFTTGTHRVVKPFMSTASVPTVTAGLRPGTEPPAAATAAASGSARPSSLFGAEVRGPELSPPPPEAPSTSETERVDLVLRALIDRARTQRVGIAQVAAELVEQAHVEQREIDAVLADLVVRDENRQGDAQPQNADGEETPMVADREAVDPVVAESPGPPPREWEPIVAESDPRRDDTVVVADRTDELTFFNESVPSRPGQMSDFELLDPEAKRRVIIRVLCLLVAMQDDNPRLVSQPHSDAEKRQWPLARAVWPVPAAAVSSDSDTIVLSDSTEGGPGTDMIVLSDSTATKGDAAAVPSSSSE